MGTGLGLGLGLGLGSGLRSRSKSKIARVGRSPTITLSSDHRPVRRVHHLRSVEIVLVPFGLEGECECIDHRCFASYPAGEKVGWIGYLDGSVVVLVVVLGDIDVKH